MHFLVALASGVLSFISSICVAGPLSVKCTDVLSPSQCVMPSKGHTVIRVCITSDSKIDTVAVRETSGYKALDDAAFSLISRGRFKAGTVNGVPVRACKDMVVTFE